MEFSGNCFFLYFIDERKVRNGVEVTRLSKWDLNQFFSILG